MARRSNDLKSKVFNGVRYTLYGVYTTQTQRDAAKHKAMANYWSIRSTRESLMDYQQCRGGAYVLWGIKKGELTHRSLPW